MLMKIRKAGPEDRGRIAAFVHRHGMDYAGMEQDEFLLAEDGVRLAGVVALRRHPDCLELCALCVEHADRKMGFGRLLVEGLVRTAGGAVYLATVIPAFFEKYGFARTLEVPRGMKKDAAWCEGCDKALCTVMIREAR
jgi:N-acetylglutamate synthase-like GNAT family acetyltransferase